MKCPNCGAELQSDVYRKLRPGHHGPQICYYCPNGDFGTDYTHPTRAIAEIESAKKWNEEREAVKHGVWRENDARSPRMPHQAHR